MSQTDSSMPEKFSGPVEPSASIQWTRTCSVGSASEVWLFDGEVCCQIVSSSEVLWLFFFQFSFQQSTAQCTCNRPMILTVTDHHCQRWLKKGFHTTLRPQTRPKSNPRVKSLDAWMAAWVMCVAASCFDSLVRCSALELCLFFPMDCAVRGMTS